MSVVRIPSLGVPLQISPLAGGVGLQAAFIEHAERTLEGTHPGDADCERVIDRQRDPWGASDLQVGSMFVAEQAALKRSVGELSPSIAGDAPVAWRGIKTPRRTEALLAAADDAKPATEAPAEGGVGGSVDDAGKALAKERRIQEIESMIGYPYRASDPSDTEQSFFSTFRIVETLDDLTAFAMTSNKNGPALVCKYVFVELPDGTTELRVGNREGVMHRDLANGDPVIGAGMFVLDYLRPSDARKRIGFNGNSGAFPTEEDGIGCPLGMGGGGRTAARAGLPRVEELLRKLVGEDLAIERLKRFGSLG